MHGKIVHNATFMVFWLFIVDDVFEFAWVFFSGVCLDLSSAWATFIINGRQLLSNVL